MSNWVDVLEPIVRASFLTRLLLLGQREPTVALLLRQLSEESSYGGPPGSDRGVGALLRNEIGVRVGPQSGSGCCTGLEGLDDGRDVDDSFEVLVDDRRGLVELRVAGTDFPDATLMDLLLPIVKPVPDGLKQCQ